MNRPPKSAAALYLLLVFLAGAAFGFAASQFYAARVARAEENGDARTAAQYRKNLVTSLDQDLNLDDDQVSEILQILDDVGDRWYQVRDAMEPEFEAIRQERAERIMAVLSPEQRLSYEKILEERRRRREEHDRNYRYGK